VRSEGGTVGLYDRRACHRAGWFAWTAAELAAHWKREPLAMLRGPTNETGDSVLRLNIPPDAAYQYYNFERTVTLF